jgi:hypothetical protein
MLPPLPRGGASVLVFIEGRRIMSVKSGFGRGFVFVFASMVGLGFGGNADAQLQPDCRLTVVKDRGGTELVSVQKGRSGVYFKRFPQENGRKFNNYGKVNSRGQIEGSPAAVACSQDSSRFSRFALPTEADASFLLSCFMVNPSQMMVLSSTSQRILAGFFPAESSGIDPYFWTSSVIPGSYTAYLMDLRMGRMVGAPYVQDYPVLCRAFPQ